MAIFELDFPDDFMKDLLETDIDAICERALTEAAPLMEEEMKKTLRNDGHELSGDLINSIKATKPKKAKNGAWIVNIRPTGYSQIKSYTVKGGNQKLRKYKVSNALKMIWIEYGVNGRQPARPFLTRTVNAVRKSTMDKMQETYNKMVGAK